MTIERVVTSGTFSLDGQDFAVENTVWLVGDDADSLSGAELRAEIVHGLDKLDDEKLRQLLRIVRLADNR